MNLPSEPGQYLVRVGENYRVALWNGDREGAAAWRCVDAWMPIPLQDDAQWQTVSTHWDHLFQSMAPTPAEERISADAMRFLDKVGA